MRVKVKMHAPPRDHARMHEAMRRQWLARKCIQILVLAHHVVAFSYLMALGVVHLAAPASTLRALGATAPPGALFLVLALLQIIPFFEFTPQHHNWHIWTHQVSRRLPPALVKAAKWNTALPYLHGLEVAANAYTACVMAATVVQPLVPLAYSALLAFHCLWSSRGLLPPVGPTRRPTLWSPAVQLGHALVSFYLSMGFVCFGLVLPAALATSNLRHHRRNLDWAAQYMPIGRFVLISDGADLVATAVAVAATYFRLQNVLSAIRAVPSRVKRTGTLISISEEGDSPKKLRILPAGGLFKSRRLQPHDHDLPLHALAVARRWRTALVLSYSMVAAVLIAVAGYSSYGRHQCPPGCRHSTSTWLSSSCDCVHIRWNCVLDGLMNDSDDLNAYLSTSFGTALRFLHVQECPLTQGLGDATLGAFPNLEAIHLERTGLTHWNLSTLPTSLYALYIHGSNLSALPPFLQMLPPTLETLYITDTPLASNVPAAVWTQWHGLYDLALTGTNQTAVADTIAGLSSLQYLDLGRNYISAMPSTLSALTSLSAVLLDENDLTEVPTVLTTGNSNLRLYLNGNPIRAVPTSLLQAVQLLLVQVASTVYCNSTHSVVCYTDCAQDCARPRLGDDYCDPPCNVSACAYDAGDCL
ncbi:hypothetical protein ACHHYP_10244 [Achlya hypogyna]|uniref:LNR domain-containing protein n=1 Tax=Achlya hypogyna TaxID=1202772 RepID=A0A1V9YLU3_ACHHY|nr:hypothetical protein ACHHYP_10244 [Achlya hypogyna]